MRDYLELGPCPYDEDAAQCGVDKDFAEKNREECRRYKAMLENRFPVPEGAMGYFTVRSNAHDFGTYREVAAVFDDADEMSVAWAFHCESKCPATWDDAAVLPVVVECEA